MRRSNRSSSKLRDVLTDVFKLMLPEGEELDTVLTRITNGAAQ